MRIDPRSALSLTTVLALLVACSGDQLTAPGTTEHRLARGAIGHEKVLLCHTQGESGHLIEVAEPGVEPHLDHGDHVARFVVDGSSIADGLVRFNRIGDALAAARAVRQSRGELATSTCRITIEVASGTYRGTMVAAADQTLERFPLVIDMPDVTLLGAFRPIIDATGRPTGAGEGEESTRLLPIAPLSTQAQYSQPLVFVNGTPDGMQGNGVIIAGFSFESGRVPGEATSGGVAIVSLRVRDLLVRGNLFGRGFSESVDLRASDGRVELNHLGADGPSSAGTCDICIAGPGDYAVTDNRLLAGGIPGILVVPAVSFPVPAGISPYVLPAASLVTAVIVNNEVRDHQRVPVGTGIRVAAVGINAPHVAGTARVEARDNVLTNNRFGMIVEAGFPVANTQRRGDIHFTMSGNVFTASCQANLLITLSRHTTGLGLASGPYLLGSTYDISLGGDIAPTDIWYSHPTGFGNSLIVDGAPVQHGTVNAYDPTRNCGA